MLSGGRVSHMQKLCSRQMSNYAKYAYICIFCINYGNGPLLSIETIVPCVIICEYSCECNTCSSFAGMWSRRSENSFVHLQQ